MPMPQVTSSKVEQDEHRLTLLVGAGCFVIISLIYVLLFSSMDAVEARTNEIVSDRSIDALQGAVTLSQAHMGNIAEINAVWDDAVTHTYTAHPDPNWLYASWGSLAKEDGDYDGVYLLSDMGKALWAAEDGKALVSPRAEDLGAGARALFAKVSEGRDKRPVTGLTMTLKGPAFVAIDLVQPSDRARADTAHHPRFVLFTRHLSAGLLRSYQSAYDIKSLSVSSTPISGLLSTPLVDTTGVAIGFLSWPPDNNGHQAAKAAWPTITASLVLVALTLTLLCITVGRAVRTITQSRDKARRAALTDSLTELPNRRAVIDRLSPNNDKALALALLDIDDLKITNETFGHEAGDAVLRQIGARLTSALVPGVMAARMGGDQFALIATGSDATAAMAEVLARFGELKVQPVQIGAAQSIVSTSAGVAIVGDQKFTARELLRQSEAALAEAKTTARGQAVYYTEALDLQLRQRSEIAEQIVYGLKNQEFSVVYQPIVSSATGKVSAVEALVRWPRRSQGALGPDQFIEIAESHGTIHELWRFVLRTACQDMKEIEDISLQVNLSPVQFGDPRLLRDTCTILAETGFPAKRLIFEVTEGQILDLPTQTQSVIAAFHELGMAMALDDFGTGYSSIGSLRHFGFDRLKIDKSMCDDIVLNPKVGELVAATIAVARALDLPVTAEGVETIEQAALLRLAGCQSLQGYLFGRPQTSESIVKMALDQAELPFAASA